MNVMLSKYTGSKDNNFNLIRLSAALLVLYTHSFAIVFGTGDAEPLRHMLGMTWGGIAVDVFFVSSGFLIAGSYISRNNIFHFAIARMLRIYPALIVAILFCVFIVGLKFTTLPAWEYLTNWQTLKFFLKNIFLFFGVEYALPGVFADIPYKNAINGSLWTLPYEVKMYALLAIVLFVGGVVKSRFAFSLRHYVLFIAVVSLAVNIYNQFHEFYSGEFMRLFSMFFVGASHYFWREKVCLSPAAFALALITLLASAFNKDIFYVVYTVCLPYLVLCAAYMQVGWLKGFNRFGDYSYGMYIYAFPVQQSISAIMPGVSVGTMIIVSASSTFFLSVLSWHLVEKRFLKMKLSTFGS